MAEGSKTASPMSEDFELPSSLTVSTFTAARSKEIQLMNNAVNTISATKMAFQKLPKHMRRRAMSHNVKRLPRKVRQIHVSQMKKSGLPPKQKRPSRKYRRRPYNLTSEYAKRQRRIRWLDTHIWHAKRFHMVEKWGYKLPERPCDKAFRACYRATAKHCLVQDISYIGCIEIHGNKAVIVETFKSITDSARGLSVAAKCYEVGHREGNITIFKHRNNEGEVTKAIGNVSFIWKQKEGSETVEDRATLWVFAHAAFFNEVLDTIKSTCDCENFKGLEVKDLRDELVRFRLTGPLSNSVLQNALKPVNCDDKTEQLPIWLNNTNLETLKKQNTYWSSLRNISPVSQLPPHVVLPLIIRDPRFNFPKKRTKSTYEMSLVNQKIEDFPRNISTSPIWDGQVRKFVKDNKMSNVKIGQMRSNLLVPGTDLEVKGDPIPIVLIQRPGKKFGESLGYASGWDMIAPTGWAQPIWLSLNIWGGRAGGLRETDWINFELCQQDFLQPDTNAGCNIEKERTQKCREIFFRLPPNKRTNFNKFRICSPFQFNWKLLIHEWKQDSDKEINDFVVVREKKLLKALHDVLVGRTNNISDIKQLFPLINKDSLVPVFIRLLDKGLCSKYSVICLPKEGDLQKLPHEPISEDVNAKKRSDLRREHKSLLRKLRNKRKSARKNGIKVIPIDKDMLNRYTSQMRKLWLPEPAEIRHSCSREVMGFITKGGFSFLIGQSKGVGYITMSSLFELLQLHRNNVLVRTTNSRVYRLGVIDVIFE